MSITTKSPTTRLLTLIAFFLAVGVLSLRTVDLFTAAPTAETARPSAERTLSNLLEPITGKGNVRVAINGAPEKSYLILINGPRTPSAASEITASDVRAVIAASTRFRADRDTLTITQLPFAHSASGQLTTLDVLEFVGLGLLCGALLLILISPNQAIVRDAAAHPSDNPAVPRPVPVSAPPAPVPVADENIGRAGDLAANDPLGTARLIRKWMGASEGGNA